MSRGLGKVERQIIDYCLNHPGWVTMIACVDEYSLDVAGVYVDKETRTGVSYGAGNYDQVKRAARRLAEKGYLEYANHSGLHGRKHIRLSIPIKPVHSVPREELTTRDAFFALGNQQKWNRSIKAKSYLS